LTPEAAKRRLWVTNAPFRHPPTTSVLEQKAAVIGGRLQPINATQALILFAGGSKPSVLRTHVPPMDSELTLSRSFPRVRAVLERRLTTILAVDVIGYSRLMGTDEAGTPMALTVFSNGAEASRRDRKMEIEPLHARIGQLTVERDFLSKGLKR
jgi:hypothetical protein